MSWNPPPPPDMQNSGQPSFTGSNPAPGWYPVEGGQRWWDGLQWTGDVVPLSDPPRAETRLGGTELGSPANEDVQNMATLAHVGQLSGLVIGFGFFVPLFLLLSKHGRSPFVAQAAKESINFWISCAIYSAIAFVSALFLIGFLIMPLVLVFWLVMPIIAGLKTHRGESYRYPLTLRFLR